MEKLARLKASIPRHSAMAVAESRQDFSAAPPAPCRLIRGLTERATPCTSFLTLSMAQSALPGLDCGKVGVNCHR